MAEPIPDRRPPKWRLANNLSWRSRPGRRRILVIALAALLICGAIWMLFGRGRDELGRDELSWNDDAPKWSPDGQRIVFESNRNDPERGLYTIYVMNADGSGLRRLTKSGTDAEHPHWSPDGKRIVYVQGQLNYDYSGEVVYGGGGKIVVMRADGSGKNELAFSHSTDDLSWSPDGRWIAYAAFCCDPESRPAVYIVHPDGSGLRLIARDSFAPAWSPDGKLLAYSSGNGELFSDHTIDVLRLATGDRFDVTVGPSGQTWPIVWSPDGSKIAFIAGEYVQNAQPTNALVYVADADGSGIYRPISQEEHLYDIETTHGLAWLPGSERVVFYSPKGAFVGSINGQHDRLLNDNACCAAEPSPDGKKALYVEASSSGSAISVAPINGGSTHRLTHTKD